MAPTVFSIISHVYQPKKCYPALPEHKQEENNIYIKIPVLSDLIINKELIQKPFISTSYSAFCIISEHIQINLNIPENPKQALRMKS